MNLLRVSFTAVSHKTFRHIVPYAVSSNVNTMICGFASAAGNLESEHNTLISDMSKAEELSRADRSGDRVSYSNTLISDISKAKNLNEATYTSLIDSLCKQDRIDNAYMVLNEMFASGFSPSDDTLSDVIRGCIRIGDMRKAFEMHNEMMYEHICGFRPSVVNLRDVLLGLLRIGDMRKAFEMRIYMNESIYVECMDDDTEYLLLRGVSDFYTSLMNAYLDEGNWDYAIELYYAMQDLGRSRDPAIHSVFINGLDDNKARTTQIKKELLKFNYKLYFFSSNRPILQYHRTLAENCSYNEFKSLVELVRGLCIEGLVNPYDTILKSNCKPNGIDDGIVYNLFIIAHCDCKNIDEAYDMYEEMVHYGFPCHMFTVFALIQTLERENMVDELRWVIENLLRSCNLNDSEILKFLNEFNPKKPDSEAFFDVLAEKAKDGLFLKCEYPPPSA